MSWLRDWKYRIKFVVDSSKIDETLQDFPVKIQLTSEHSHLFYIIEHQNRKIAVISSGKQCYVEIEKWETSINSAILWVKIPYLSDAEDTEFYLYYDSDQNENEDFIGGSYSLLENVDDDFTGNDGDLPDPDKWISAGTGTISIQNNVMNMKLLNSDTDTADAYNLVYALTRYRCVGDLDIQIDWELIQYVISFSWVSGLNITDTDGNYWQLFISNEGSGNTKYVGYWNDGSGSAVHLGHTSGKFRVTRVSGKIRLYYYTTGWVEYPNAGAQSSSSISIKIDCLSMNNKPDLEIEYDNYIVNSVDSIIPRLRGAATKQVWDDNYVGVWHLNNYPPDKVYDSTDNDNDGTPSNMEFTDLITTNVSPGLNFDDSPKYINCGQISELSNSVSLTFEAVIKQDTVTDYDRAVSLHYNLDNRVDIITYPTGIIATISEVTNNVVLRGSNVSAINEYHQVSLVRDGTNLHTYVDLDTWALACTHDNSDMPGTPTLYIAYQPVTDYIWDGQIDEVRISDIARSAAWIKATYYSNWDELFISSTIENKFGSWQDVNQMTIDHNLIDEDLVDFPIRMNTANLGGYNAIDITDTFDQLDVDPDLYDQYTVLQLHGDGDLSDSRHNLTFYNEPKIYSTGPFNSSYYFNGTDNYISIPDSSDWDFGTDDFTVECFAKFSSIASTKCLFGRGDGTGDNRYNLIWSQTDLLSFGHEVGGVNTSASSDSWTPTVDVLYHIAMVRIDTTIWFYVDGVSYGSDTTVSSVVNLSNELTIGMGQNSSGTDSNYFDGTISNIRVSKGIARWTVDFNIPTEPYTPDEYDVLLLPCSGDKSKSGHVLTMNNDPEIHADVARFDGSYYFDGVDDYISIPDNDDSFAFGGDSFTIDFWIKRNRNSLLERVFGQYRIEETYTPLQFYIPENNTLILYYFYNITDSEYVGSSSTITDTDWHHIAFVKDSINTSLKVFIDGVEDGSNLSASHSQVSTTSDFSIGRMGEYAFQYFQGYIAEFRISKGIARYTSNFIPPSSKFTDPDINTKLMLTAEGDKSDSQHTLTFINEPKIYSNQDTPSGHAYYLNGTDDYITMPDSSDWNFGSENFTMECFASFSSIDSSKAILGRGDETGDNRWNFYWHESLSQIGFTSVVGGSSTVSYSESWTPTVDRLYHIAIVRIDTTIWFYVDGVSYGSDTIVSSVVDLSNELRIGINQDASGVDINFFHGYLSDIRISKGIARYEFEFEMSNEIFSDDFSGVDGDPPDPFNWSVSLTHEDMQCEIDNNRLYVRSRYNESHNSIRCNGKVRFPEDFDIQVDFERNETPTFNHDTGFYFRLDSTNYGYTGIKYNAGLKYYAAAKTNGTWETEKLVGTSDVSGKIRLTRVGTQISTYYWDGSEWESLKAFTFPVGVINFQLILIVQSTSLPWSSIWYDNFIINSSTSLWYKGSIFTPSTTSFESDQYTKLLLHPRGDRSLSSHTITTNGSVKNYTTGKFEGSYYFNGTTDYISIPDSDDWTFGADDFTIDFWVKWDGTVSTTCTFLSQWEDLNNRWIFTKQNGTDSGSLIFHYLNASVEKAQFYVTWSPAPDTWYHIALVRNRTTGIIFIDGVSQSLTTTTDFGTNVLSDIVFPLEMGFISELPGNWMKGWLEEIRITKGKALWTADFTPPVSPFDRSGVNRNKLAITASDIYSDHDVLRLPCINDESWSQHDITFVNNPQIYANGSYSFDGVDAYITVPDSDDWDFGGNDFTVECMFKVHDDQTDNGYMVSQFESMNNGWIFIWNSNNYVRFLAANGGGDWTIDLTGSVPVKDGSWHHCAAVRDGDEWNLYLDGIIDSTTTNSFVLSNFSAPIEIGAYNSGTKPFKGNISGIRISKGIARYTSEFTPPTEPFIADYTTKLLLNTKGDESNSQHTLTFNGGDGYSSVGKFGGSYYFNGTTDYISIPDSDDWHFGSDDFTIDFWINMTANPDQYDLLMGYREAAGAFDGWQIGFDYDNTDDDIWISLISILYKWEGVTLPVAGWHHMAIIRNGTDLRMYLDGISQGSKTSSDDVVGNAGYTFEIGRNPNNSLFFDGYLSNIRITKGIARWTTNFAPPASPIEVDETQLPVEIENWEYDGKEATLWTKVPFVSSLYNTPINMYYDRTQKDQGILTSEEASDDFTGQNGLLPDSVKWITGSWSGISKPELYNNKLRGSEVDVTSSGGCSTKTTYSIYGDFDIQFDFDIIVDEALSSGGSDINLRVSEWGSGIGCWVRWLHSSSSTTYQAYETSGNNYSYNTSDTSGKLRLKRVGSTITAYIWSGVQWEWNGNTSGQIITSSYSYTRQRMYIQQNYGSSGGGTDFTVDVDNFKINKADKIIGGYIGETGTPNAQNVWDNNFVGVWHMNQEPVGADNILDSTINASHVSPNSMVSGDLVDSKIGKGLKFDDSYLYRDVSDTTFDISDEITVDVIVRGNRIDNYLIGNCTSNQNSGFFKLSTIANSRIQFSYTTGATERYFRTTDGISNLISSYTNITFKHTWGDSSSTSIFINGVKVSAAWVAGGSEASGPTAGNCRFEIGHWYGTPLDQDYYTLDGTLDENRISTISRSDAWIKATHYSNFDELLRMGPGWKYVLSSSDNMVLRRIEKVNGVLIQNISEILKR
jgi:regulation of enolase protein 1 (concanavalin A-like superfamily)